jgi:PAS domain S-box-containing protein
MKIATKLKLAAMVPALMALVIGFALFFSFKVVQEAQRLDRSAQQIITGMSGLSNLVGEHVLYHEQRPLQQFLVEHNSVSTLIADMRFSDREEQQILEGIRRDLESMKGSFLKLVSNHERYGSDQDSRLIKEVESRLAGRLLVWSRDIASDASYLERRVDEQLTSTQGKISVLVFVLIVVTTLFLTAILMGITRSITASLMMLRKGTEVIGAGNLDHKVAMSARDEIGELSRSFDRMTEQLRKVTVSKNTLEQEVEERKKAEAALWEQREWFRVTLDSIGDAVMAADTGGRVSFLNPVASTLTGWPPEEAQGRPIRNVLRTVNELTREPAEDIVERVLTEGRVVNMANHTALVGRDGTETPIEDSAAPIKDGAGNLLGVVIVFHDVTEKRRAQNALRESAERLRIVADFTYDWEYWRSPDNRFLYVSPSCERVTGFTRQEFFDDPDLYSRILHPGDRSRVLTHLREDQFHRELCELEFRILRRDGRECWIAHACRPVLDEQGQMLGRRASNRDITERKRVEQELETSRNELERRVRERTAELERRNKDLEDFAFIASHDLQEPLRKIRTFGDLLLNKTVLSLNEPSRDYLQRMIDSAARMQTLLKALLKYSRVTRQERIFNRIDLGKSVEESIRSLEMLVQEKGALVEVGDLPKLEADPAQMTQLFQNLIGNALKFHRPNEPPRVRIYAHALEQGGPGKGKAYEICVEDNGIGFEAEKHFERILLPFQRLHGSSEYGGVGMGLAICRKIVERHGGNLKARSTPGEGSTFIITLPEKQGSRRDSQIRTDSSS